MSREHVGNSRAANILCTPGALRADYTLAMQARRATQCNELANGAALRTIAIRAGMIGLVALAAGCGGSPPAIPPVPASFPVHAVAAVSSTSGALHVELRSVPDPLVRGQNVGQLTLTDGSGQPAARVTVEVLPWMPSHGHGTSQAVEITDQGGGVFIANPLYLFMAGEWQIQMKFQGAIDDTAMATVEIP